MHVTIGNEMKERHIVQNLLIILAWFSLNLGVDLQASTPRYISTTPSICYTLIDLKVEKSIVGTSNYCEFKSEKIGSLLTPDLEKIVKLKPTIVFSQKIENDNLDRKLAKLKIKHNRYLFDSYIDLKESIRKIGKDVNSKHYIEILISFLKTEKVLKKKNIKGKYAFAINIKDKNGKLVGMTVAGRKTFFTDVINLTSLKNAISKTSGYIEWDLEKFINSKLNYLFILSHQKRPISDKIRKQLLVLNSNLKIIEVFNEGAHAPSTRTVGFLKELEDKLND
ncbi:MAG: ABC transporter substrate-binding protein [Oligoflexia bacterium]|nr:ABC transporter substrate-binding protein [Oligoflexia bacterium]